MARLFYLALFAFATLVAGLTIDPDYQQTHELAEDHDRRRRRRRSRRRRSRRRSVRRSRRRYRRRRSRSRRRSRRPTRRRRRPSRPRRSRPARRPTRRRPTRRRPRPARRPYKRPSRKSKTLKKLYRKTKRWLKNRRSRKYRKALKNFKRYIITQTGRYKRKGKYLKYKNRKWGKRYNKLKRIINSRKGRRNWKKWKNRFGKLKNYLRGKKNKWRNRYKNWRKNLKNRRKGNLLKKGWWNRRKRGKYGRLFGKMRNWWRKQNRRRPSWKRTYSGFRKLKHILSRKNIGGRIINWVKKKGWWGKLKRWTKGKINKLISKVARSKFSPRNLYKAIRWGINKLKQQFARICGKTRKYPPRGPSYPPRGPSYPPRGPSYPPRGPKNPNYGNEDYGSNFSQGGNGQQGREQQNGYQEQPGQGQGQQGGYGQGQHGGYGQGQQGGQETPQIDFSLCDQILPQCYSTCYYPHEKQGQKVCENGLTQCALEHCGQMGRYSEEVCQHSAAKYALQKIRFTVDYFKESQKQHCKCETTSGKLEGQGAGSQLQQEQNQYGSRYDI